MSYPNPDRITDYVIDQRTGLRYKIEFLRGTWGVHQVWGPATDAELLAEADVNEWNESHDYDEQREYAPRSLTQIGITDFLRNVHPHVHETYLVNDAILR